MNVFSYALPVYYINLEGIETIALFVKEELRKMRG